MNSIVIRCQVPQHKSAKREAESSCDGGGGEAVWTIVEQVALAAVDVANYELANACLARLQERFSPSSVRVERLHGMVLEAKGAYREALQLYHGILQRDPTNAVCVTGRTNERTNGATKSSRLMITVMVMNMIDHTQTSGLRTQGCE